MSDANAQEPTMEEILASIRRIISEDDAPAADAAPAEAAAPEAEPESEAEPEAEPEPLAAAPEPEPAPVELAAEPEEPDDILELTDPIALSPRPPAEALGDLDVFTREETPPPPAFSSAPEPEADEDEPLVSPPSADRAATYFGNLSRSLSMPSEGRTLEDLVSELIRPMLKEWLDQHLPAIVEAKVQAEVERVSRSRR